MSLHLLFPFSKDGTVIVHTIRRGQFLRSLRPPGDSSVPAHISQLQVGMEGHMVVQTSLEERSNREVRSQTITHYRRTILHFSSLNSDPSPTCRANTPFTFTR